MKKPICILALVLLVSLSSSAQKRAVYPNQVQQSPNMDWVFVTNDPFEKLQSFFTDLYGKPDKVMSEGVSKLASFYYHKSVYHDESSKSVLIEHLRGNERAIARIIENELKGLIVRNIITEARHKEIEEKYGPLQKHFYRYTQDENGNWITEAEAIYKKYEARSGMGSQYGTDMGSAMAKAQELMMSGKMKEGMELIEKAKKQQMDAIDYAKSDAIANDWIACLEEIKAASFTSRINYGPDY